MPPSPETGVVAVDLGKTTCRVRFGAGADRLELRGAGSPGLATVDGTAAAFAALAPLIDAALQRAGRDPDGEEGPRPVRLLGIGAAGAEADRAAATRLAELARERWGAETAVGSDVLTAHLGAFSGGPGTVLIAGTGAVAWHISADGSRARSDGWGPLLGDEGSGRWIGQQGLIGALRGADGRGPRTALEDDAAALAGGLDALPAFIGSGDAARKLASFAPAVLDRAREGDAIAGRIAARAAELIARAAAAVTPDRGEVAVVGGLAEDAGFLGGLLSALRSHGLSPRRPDGTALDGAAELARRHDLPHERYAVRV